METSFGLYLILTNPVVGYEKCATIAVKCGVRYLQLRMKDESLEKRFRVARFVREITDGTETSFIVNDDLDLAMAVDADGLHVGQEDDSVLSVRKRWNRPEKIFGLSTHSFQQAKEALKQSPDYLGVGPVFSTSTKKNVGPALGVKEVSRIVQLSPLPCVAIGGINIERVDALFHLNVFNFAVISAVNQSLDPEAQIRRLIKKYTNLRA